MYLLGRTLQSNKRRIEKGVNEYKKKTNKRMSAVIVVKREQYSRTK